MKNLFVHFNKLFFITFLLTINFILFISIVSGQIRGVEGNAVTFKTINASELPSLPTMFMGASDTIAEETEPPPGTIFTPPETSILPNVTIDSSAFAPQPFGPGESTSYPGVTQNGYIPGEPVIAAGPDHVISLANCGIVIYQKSGSLLVLNQTQAVFFGIPVAEGAGFDAKCMYDAIRGRFVLLTESMKASLSINKYYLAVSATSNAMGVWYIYSFDMTLDGVTSTSNWADFPGLGISDDKIVMSGQQFTFSGNSYQYNKIRVIDRASAYAGTVTAYFDFFNWPIHVFCTKPGRNLTSGTDIYLLATHLFGGNTIQLRKLTGPATSGSGGPTLGAPLSTAQIDPILYGNFAKFGPGGNGALTVNQGDCRTNDFFVRNGVLSIAFHCGVNWGTAGSPNFKTAIKYLQIDVSPLVPVKLTDETYGASNSYFFFYPATVVDSRGNMFMGFGRSSTSEFASQRTTGKRSCDLAIQKSDLSWSGAGVAVTSQSRWGDYTGITLDESYTTNEYSYAWYSGLYAKSSGEWGSRLSAIYYWNGNISGTVWRDADGDLSHTSDQTRIQGWGVTLKIGSTIVETAVTDNLGEYHFCCLPASTAYKVVFNSVPIFSNLYICAVTAGTGAIQTAAPPRTVNVNLLASQSSNLNNLYVSPWHWTLPASLSRWHDPACWADSIVPVSNERIGISTGSTVVIDSGIICKGLNLMGNLKFDSLQSLNAIVTDSLLLSNGNFKLGNSNLVIGVNGMILGADSLKHIVTDGTGQLKKIFSGIGSFQFPIGYSSASLKYSPATINFVSGTFGPNSLVGMKVNNVKHPNNTSTTNYLNRYWSVTQAGISDFVCNTNLTYANSDIAGIEDSIYCGKFQSSWSLFNKTNSSTNTLTANGISSFSDFTGGERSLFISSTTTLNLTVLIEGFFNGAQMVRDTMRVYLRNNVSPYSIVDSGKVYLTVNGNGQVNFNNVNSGIYYIQLKHRNSIETWSKSGGESFIKGGTTSYNFTNSSSQAYQNNMIQVFGNKWCIYGGDVNQNSGINLSDILAVSNDATSFVTGYVNSDLNGNNVVNLNDILLVFNNSSMFVVVRRP